MVTPGSPPAVVDMHSDMLIEPYLQGTGGGPGVVNERHLPKLRAAGINCLWVTVGGDWWKELPVWRAHPTVHVIEMLDVLREVTEAAASPFKRVRNGSEAQAAIDAGLIALLPTLEGGAPLGGSLPVLRAFYQLGVRSMSLTHRYRNELADGNAEAITNSGLTRFGLAVVEEMNRLGMIVDVSHLSGKAVDQVLDICRGPVIASHTNSSTLHPIARNLDDGRLRKIAASGGVVGVSFYRDHLAAQASIENILDQVEHLARILGIEHVGLGPDFIDYLPATMGLAGPRTRGAEDASCIPAVLSGLSGRGFSDAEVRKIAGGNAVRVAKAVLG